MVAADPNGLIGADNRLPWHLPEDLKHFKALTTGNAIVMGRRTFDSIGRALPKRFNIVVTSRPAGEFPEGVAVAPGLSQACDLAQKQGYEQVFLIGGRRIFAEGLPLAHRLLLTRVEQAFAGDVYLPPVDWENWQLAEDSGPLTSRNGLPYRIQSYRRSAEPSSFGH